MGSLGKFEGSDDMAKQIMAKLVRGKVYYLGNKLFRAGEAVAVTKAERNHLEEHAQDAVTVSQGDSTQAEDRAKFDFEEVDVPSDDAGVAGGEDTSADTDEGAGEGASDAAQGNARGGNRRR